MIHKIGKEQRIKDEKSLKVFVCSQLSVVSTEHSIVVQYCLYFSLYAEVLVDLHRRESICLVQLNSQEYRSEAQKNLFLNCRTI